jgi:hypothetical protein
VPLAGCQVEPATLALLRADDPPSRQRTSPGPHNHGVDVGLGVRHCAMPWVRPPDLNTVSILGPLPYVLPLLH